MSVISFIILQFVWDWKYCRSNEHMLHRQAFKNSYCSSRKATPPQWKIVKQYKHFRTVTDSSTCCNDLRLLTGAKPPPPGSGYRNTASLSFVVTVVVIYLNRQVWKGLETNWADVRSGLWGVCLTRFSLEVHLSRINQTLMVEGHDSWIKVSKWQPMLCFRASGALWERRLCLSILL